MRNISLPVLYKAALPPAESDFEEAADLRKLGGRVTAAALAIEELIVGILSSTLLQEVREHKELVLGSILKSDWCTFSAKRKLLELAASHFQLLSGSAKSELEGNLAKVMRYRNAFAHGSLVNNFEGHELHYFEGRPMQARLDDAYFGELERVFQAAWNQLLEIQSKLGGSGG